MKSRIMLRLCFISYMYPGRHNSSDSVFVKHLVDAIAAMGNECYVLSPYNVLHYRTYCPVHEYYSVGHGEVHVLRPWYLSFSVRNSYLRKVGAKNRNRAMEEAFRMLPAIPDAIYGHFWHIAYGGFNYAKNHNIPLFVASGESEITFRNNNKTKASFCDYVRGVVCVSSKNREESIQLKLTSAEKCGVFPNAVNASMFYKRDKSECRKKLKLPLDDFIVAFVGWFDERKGASRVAEALRQLPNVKSLFIGKGTQEPQCDGILFKGTLTHEQVPLYLNAADCFVLPTQHEGCCNAVVEAMACGLPVISSNLPFNWDVLDETNSIMIDPNNIDEIAKAIKHLYNNREVCAKLSEGALRKAEKLTIDNRAKAIVNFITSRI